MVVDVPKYLLLVLLSACIAMATISCTGRVRSLEQIALDEFVGKFWNEDLFRDECTGMQFESSGPLYVYVESPGYTVNFLDFAAIVPFDVREVAETGGLETFKRLGTMEPAFGPVDLSQHKFARPSPTSAPREEKRPSEGYLLRFSNRVRFGHTLYLQLWIKGDSSSSGRRIDFRYDESGRLLESKKLEMRCDDWG